MDIRLIPKDEIISRKADKNTIKELIENVRKRRKHYSKHNSERQKKKTDCRNNNLDPRCPLGKGYITEVLVAKKLGIKTCFDVTGNFKYSGYDILEHKNWGKINVKGSLLSYNGDQIYHYFNTNKNTKSDFFFCIGYDYEMKHIISIYIIPNNDYVSTLNGITIPYDSNSKWNKFKENEKEIEKWDCLLHSMKLENCTVLRSGKSSNIIET